MAVATPPAGTPVRVLLVDDEPLIRSGLCGVLTPFTDIDVVGEAGNAHEAVARIETDSAVDVVLMDVRMPGLDGLSATERILATRPTVKVLVLATFDSDDYVYRALQIGAAGFLLKRWPADRIGEAIRIAAADTSVVFPDNLAQAVAGHGSPPPTSDGSIEDSLSPCEQIVLQQMAKGLTNAEIAAGLFVSVETVKSQVKAVLRKLGVWDRTAAVVRAFETGFVTPAGRDGDRH